MEKNLNIDHIAKLAKLDLTEEEKPILAKEISSILNFVEVLNELNTNDIEPTFQVTQLTSIGRDDVVHDNLSQTDALSNAKSTDGGFFVTKGVFEDRS